MFFHTFRYSIKTLLRDKGQMFWCLFFPIILGTLFQFAFGHLDDGEAFQAIPVAVVMEDEISEMFLTEVFDAVSEPGENQFLEVTYCEEDKARELLEQKEIVGIILCDDKIHLLVSGEMKSEQLSQSILKVFVERVSLTYDTMTQVAMTHPEKLPVVIQSIQSEANYIVEENFTDGNYSSGLIYFFDLIAMACLYAAFMGNTVAYYFQANLSPLGARRLLSPTKKLVSVLGSLMAAEVIEFCCIGISVLYLKFVLGVDFGNQMGYVILVVLAGTLVGISLGFFIGSVGRMDVRTKFGLLILITMSFCTLSGLMYEAMPMYVERVCPLFNRINPAAALKNALYSLVIYPDHNRFFNNIYVVLGESVLFYILGLLMIRRKKYASL